MVAVEAILEASATMIVGILFVVTLAEALKVKYIGKFAFYMFFFGVAPFSISAVFALFDIVLFAVIFCATGFLYFTVLLLGIAYQSFKKEEENR